MMIKLYKQMDETRVHAEKKCRKFMTPAAEFNPVIQHWYDRIHAYMDLLKLKQGAHKHMNKGNVRRNAKGGHQKPSKLDSRGNPGCPQILQNKSQ